MNNPSETSHLVHSGSGGEGGKTKKLELEREQELATLKGKSLPSSRYGAWIVDQVSSTLEGRSRLVTADLKGEQWVWTVELVRMMKEYEKDCRSVDNERLAKSAKEEK